MWVHVESCTGLEVYGVTQFLAAEYDKRVSITDEGCVQCHECMHKFEGVVPQLNDALQLGQKHHIITPDSIVETENLIFE
jgi:hypothetical protein